MLANTPASEEDLENVKHNLSEISTKVEGLHYYYYLLIFSHFCMFI